jgi:hypothetical protein
MQTGRHNCRMRKRPTGSPRQLALAYQAPHIGLSRDFLQDRAAAGSQARPAAPDRADQPVGWQVAYEHYLDAPLCNCSPGVAAWR